jgi:hypothetical protein
VNKIKKRKHEQDQTTDENKEAKYEKNVYKEKMSANMKPNSKQIREEIKTRKINPHRKKIRGRNR